MTSTNGRTSLRVGSKERAGWAGWQSCGTKEDENRSKLGLGRINLPSKQCYRGPVCINLNSGPDAPQVGRLIGESRQLVRHHVDLDGLGRRTLELNWANKIARGTSPG